MDQSSIFKESEGDAWFNRNQSQLQNIDQVENLLEVRYERWLGKTEHL